MSAINLPRTRITCHQESDKLIDLCNQTIPERMVKKMLEKPCAFKPPNCLAVSLILSSVISIINAPFISSVTNGVTQSKTSPQSLCPDDVNNLRKYSSNNWCTQTRLFSQLPSSHFMVSLYLRRLCNVDWWKKAVLASHSRSHWTRERCFQKSSSYSRSMSRSMVFSLIAAAFSPQFICNSPSWFMRSSICLLRKWNFPLLHLMSWYLQSLSRFYHQRTLPFDYQSVIGVWKPPWHLHSTIEDIKWLAASFHSIRWRHVF